MARQRMSSADSVFVHLEDPTNLMMVTAVMLLGTPVDYVRLATIMEHRLLAFDRFRQRVVASRLHRGTLYWKDVAGIDLDYHLQRATLSVPGDQAALQETVSLLASRPLELSRPLWQFHLVESYGQGSALICRLHHSLGDGMALMQVLLSLADDYRDAAQPTSPAGAAQLPRRGWQDTPLTSMYGRFRARRQRAHQLGRKALSLLGQPPSIASAAEKGIEVAAAVAKLGLAGPDPATVLKGELGVTKRAAWSERISLGDVKTVGSQLGGTVNDVLLAAVTGALRRYLHERGDPLKDAEFRATIPVNMRTPGTEDELGNQIGVYLLDLPVGIVDPVARFRELKERMDRIKHSPEASVTSLGLKAVGRFSARTQRCLINLLGIKATSVITNVRGPEEQLYLAGAPLEALLAWVPKAGGLGIGVSILSYVGQVRLGVITDAGLVPDPETIVAGIQAEFDALLALAQQTREMPAAAELGDMLDDALATLDSLLTEDQAKGPNAQAGALARCRALTKTGRLCRNRALPGSDFCHVHEPERHRP
ncbi:MAG: wax ester/triacylglycerol synthase family O-acyltransferase [Anaerolineae bacterium]